MKFVLLLTVLLSTLLFMFPHFAVAVDNHNITLSIIIGDTAMMGDNIDINKSRIELSSPTDQEITIPQNISFSLEVYRGKTLKRTVYVYIKDRTGSKISSTTKFSLSKRFTDYNLSGNIKVSRTNYNDTYTFVAEGIDTISEKEIELSFIDEELSASTQPIINQKISFNITDVLSFVTAGQSFKTRVVAYNPTPDDLEFDAWSYVYKGSRCISGDREQNRKTINFPEHSNVTFDLENIIDPGADPGEYLIKVKIQRSDRKTPVEMKREIRINSDEKILDEELSSESIIPSVTDDKLKVNSANYTPSKKEIVVSPLTITGNSVIDYINESEQNTSGQIVFQSSSAKAKNLVTYFLILLLAVILIAVALKKL